MPHLELMTKYFVAGIAAIVLASCKTPSDVAVSKISFSNDKLEAWQSREFAGNTDYSIVTLDDRRVLRAHSDASASALFREIEVNLSETPYINWQWRIENVYPPPIDERSRAGDDYPARLYVVIADGYQPWEVLAVNYVWSSNQAVGSTWVNAWSERAQMVALRQGATETGRWRTEKRNIQHDFLQLFEREIEAIKGIAIMVDSDNTQHSATAYFGDIWFSAQ